MTLRFEWDEVKRQSNLENHGFDFADVEYFFHTLKVVESTKPEHRERRWIGFGALGDVVVAVVFTVREAGYVIRVISMRKAKRREKKALEGT